MIAILVTGSAGSSAGIDLFNRVSLAEEVFCQLAQGYATCGEVVVDSGIKGFAHLHHFAEMQGQDLGAIRIEAQISDQAMNVEIGVVGTAGFVREKRRDHVRGLPGRLGGGQIAPAIPDGGEGFEPVHLILHGSEKLRLETSSTAAATEKASGAVYVNSWYLTRRFAWTFERPISRKRRHIPGDESAKGLCVDLLACYPESFGEPSMLPARLVLGEVIACSEMAAEVGFCAFGRGADGM